MIKHVTADIFTLNDIDIIGHQVNCLGLMGSGVARQVALKYPQVYETYKSFVSSQKDISKLLGTCHIAEDNGMIVANLFGQADVNKCGNNAKQTDYTALKSAFLSLAEYAMATKNYNIAIPYKIGCDLGGGDWTIVYDIISDIFDSNDDYGANINLTIAKLPG